MSKAPWLRACWQRSRIRSLAKAGRTVFLKQQVVDLAAMEGQADRLLLAVGDGLSGWLVRGDGDEGDLPWGGLGSRRRKGRGSRLL